MERRSRPAALIDDADAGPGAGFEPLAGPAAVAARLAVASFQFDGIFPDPRLIPPPDPDPPTARVEMNRTSTLPALALARRAAADPNDSWFGANSTLTNATGWVTNSPVSSSASPHHSPINVTLFNVTGARALRGLPPAPKQPRSMPIVNVSPCTRAPKRVLAGCFVVGRVRGPRRPQAAGVRNKSAAYGALAPLNFTEAIRRSATPSITR